MTRILAIDPGTHQSAYVVWDGKTIHAKGLLPNEDLLTLLKSGDLLPYDRVAIEMIASYGMSVGASVFETCVWVGRFAERCKRPCRYVYRKDVKLHLCHSTRAKDANIRQALIDRLGPQGTKKSPGPTYGISKDVWAALAVAIYAADNASSDDS